MIDDFELNERLKSVTGKGINISFKFIWADRMETFVLYENFAKQNNAPYSEYLREHIGNLIDHSYFSRTDPVADPSLEVEGEIIEEDEELFLNYVGYIKEWKSYVDGTGEKQRYQEKNKSDDHIGKIKLFNL